MATKLDRLYPSYRWYLFDARERFAAPYSVFGAGRAVIYVGDLDLVLTTTELIREFASHFDGLIRAARVQPNETRRWWPRSSRTSGDHIARDV